MDGLDSAKCQKSRRRDMNGIYKIVNEEKDKIWNSGLLLQKEAKMCGAGEKGMQWLGFCFF